MDFWDTKRGIAFSDPVEGKLFLIETNNGGAKWNKIPFRDCPQMQDGEAGFAASGTSIRTVGDGYAYIGTGGRSAHVFSSDNYGRTWKKFPCPILKGKESTGVFSLAFRDGRTGIIIGGDYNSDTLSKDNCFITYNAGKSWKPPLQSPSGYRSCIEYITSTLLIATGTTGTDLSRDGGNTWKNISSVGFNVVRKSKKGGKVFFAGNHGLIGMVK